MKEETKSNIEILLIGLVTFLVGFLFLNNKKETKKDATAEADYKEKDLI